MLRVVESISLIYEEQFSYLVLDLGEGVPHLEEDGLQEPVPDVQGQRDQDAGYAHHRGLKVRKHRADLNPIFWS